MLPGSFGPETYSPFVRENSFALGAVPTNSRIKLCAYKLLFTSNT